MSDPARADPHAAFFAPAHDESLWTQAPWILEHQVDDTPGDYDIKLVTVWLRPPRASEIAGVERTLRPAPDRPHDIEFHNVGHAPELGFWHFHPRIEAFEVEHDEDDGAAWWARIWLRQGP
ncbi:hypothetical protein [Caulobacter hibisci]|uniref:Uncharacterized protein n=1 Tax=Caulobacter hibisci TaxID=2035993 RepID=A0ABS0T024_9CAUL|nr:hypothetical protein [Caulobacter hibisci]MBI1685204.1 hypothetical protein [Caulobacter hibisci]